MNINKIREDFALLNSKKSPIYLDSACMSLKPRQVIEKMSEYYNEYPACAGRSNHRLSTRATEEFHNARVSLRKLINARSEKEIIFTRNTTEGINLVSRSLDYDVIMTTDKEHNSNHVPWLQSKAKREIILTSEGFDLESFKNALSDNKGKKILISMVHTSNMDGTTHPIRDIIKIGHDHGALVLLDCAQSVPHSIIDVKKLDVDFISFSGHKMLGPTGTGVLYGKEDMLGKLRPYNTGGDTVKDTTYTSAEFEDAPEIFEAGLQDYAGMIGLGEAARYVSKYLPDIEDHQHKLNKIMTEGLKDHVNILGPQDHRSRSGIFSFTAKNGMAHHEVALLLDNYANVLVRSGRHCVHSWFNAHNIDGSTRASAYLYNTEEEAKIFVEKTKEILKMKG